MKNKFGKNDKFIYHAFVLVDVIAVLILVSVVVIGGFVISTVSEGNLIVIFEGIVIIMLAAPISSFCFFVFGRVLLNALCDLKLIRNKLYDEDNDYIKKLVSDKDDEADYAPPKPLTGEGGNASLYNHPSYDGDMSKTSE